MCRSGQLAKTMDFYTKVLGMASAAVPEQAPRRGEMQAVSYSSKAQPHGREPVLLAARKPTLPWLSPYRRVYCDIYIYIIEVLVLVLVLVLGLGWGGIFKHIEVEYVHLQ